MIDLAGRARRITRFRSLPGRRSGRSGGPGSAPFPDGRADLATGIGDICRSRNDCRYPGARPSTERRPTTRVPVTPRNSATPSRSARTICVPWRLPAAISRRPSACWNSGTRPPTTSSPPSRNSERRAALWRRVAQLSGVAAGSAELFAHAVTSAPMLTRYDPWVNLLRTTVAAFAAGVGGADAVTVLPFDSRLGVPDALGPADGQEHLVTADQRVARRGRRRPGRRIARGGDADGRPGRRGVGRIPDHRTIRRCARGSRRRFAAGQVGGHGGRTGRGGSAPAGNRSPGSANSRICEKCCPARRSARSMRLVCRRRGPRRSRRCVTNRPRPRSSWRPWAAWPTTPHEPASPPTCSPPAGSTP